MKIGVVSNERSHANRKAGSLADLRGSTDDTIVARLKRSSNGDRADLDAVLADFAARGVEVIVVDAGDGTIRDIVTRLDATYGEEWPALALIPSGKTNAIAGDVGHSGMGAAALDRLLAARDAGTLGRRATDRPALEVSWPGHRTLRGFLFGYAAFTEGVRFANERIHTAGVNKGLAVVLSIGGAMRRVMAGPTDGERGAAATLSVDGDCVNAGRSFVMLASTLDRLTPGLRPFWDRGRGAVRWLDLPAPLHRSITGVARMALGRPKPWMEAAGYRSGRAETLEVSLDTPFVLDGELFDAEGPINIATTRPIRFLRA
ncbi:MAG: diacylglycerol kinase family protein [Pseudomonadota bacterium]